MRANTVVAIAAAAAVLFLIWRARQNQNTGTPTIATAADVDWIPDPEADAAWWAINSGGTPSPAGSRGAGVVTPSSKLIESISQAFPGNLFAWSSPNANTNPVQQKSFSPPGATILPGPVPPAQPTPQGPTESTSPWLPAGLDLRAPVAASPWFMELSLADPYALLAYKGGYIDVERVAAL